MKKVILFLAALLSVVGFQFAAAPVASAAPCDGLWTIGVAGVGGNGASFGADQWVGYSAVPFGFSVQEGVNELNRLTRAHRAECPADHITQIGHSLGASVVHSFLTQQGNIGNTNAILLADPKKPWTGPVGPGIGGTVGFLGAPLAGTDDFYRGVPVLQVCAVGRDAICDINAGVPGFVGYFSGQHVAPYNFNVYAYPLNASGFWAV